MKVLQDSMLRRDLIVLVLTNAATLALALWADWSIRHVLWPWLVQGIAIMWYGTRRLSDANAVFGVVLGFHLPYLILLSMVPAPGPGESVPVDPFGARLSWIDLIGLLGCSLLFWNGQRAAFSASTAADHIEGDEGTRISLLVLRAIPIHIAMIVALAGAFAAALVAFVIGKTVLDATGLWLERRLGRTRLLEGSE